MYTETNNLKVVEFTTVFYIATVATIGQSAVHMACSTNL